MAIREIIGNTTTTPVPQSDWNQTDVTKVDYIKNKPAIVQTIGDSETSVMSQKSVTDNFDAILSVFETKGGHNLLDPSNAESGYYNKGENGELVKTGNTYQMRTVTPISVIGGSKLYVKTNVDNATCLVSVVMLDENDNVIGIYNTQFSVAFAGVKIWSVPINITKVHMFINGVNTGLSFDNVCVSSTEITEYEKYGMAKTPTAVKYDALPGELAEDIGSVRKSIYDIKNPIQGQVIDNFQSVDDWCNEASAEGIITSISSDTEDYLLGSQSVHFEGGIRKDDLGIDVQGREFRIKFKVNSIDTNAYLRLAITNTESKSAYWVLCKGNQSEKATSTPFGEWIELVLPWSALYGVDAVSAYSTIRTIKIQSVKGNCDVNVQMISLDDKRESKGIVTFTFDDSNATDYTKAAPILGARGIAATAYVIPQYIQEGRSGFLSETQLMSLKYDYNWDIEGHWAIDMGTMTEEELTYNFNSVKTYIREKGLGNCDHFAYAGGDRSGAVEKVARKYFTTARTIHSALDCGIGSQNNTNYHRLPAITGISDMISVDNLNEIFNRISQVAQYGGWLILVFHVIGDGDTSLYCSEQGLAQIADYTIASGVDIKTIDEVIRDAKTPTSYIKQEYIPYKDKITELNYDKTYEYTKWISGYGLADNGQPFVANARKLSDFIDIATSPLIYKHIENGGKYNIGAYALYDADKNYIPNSYKNAWASYEFETINGIPYCYRHEIDNLSARYIRIEASSEYSFIKLFIVPNENTYIMDSNIATPNMPSDFPFKKVENHLLKGKTIVALGDSIFGNNQSESGVANQIATRIVGTVINGAFGGTRMSLRGTANTGYDKFDFPSIAHAIASGDYSEQEQALEDYSLPTSYSLSLSSLKNTDFNDVDIIIFNYGTNDWTSSVEKTIYQEAMENSVSAILQVYPYIKFVAITPTWRCWISDGTITEDSDNKTYGASTLPQLIDNMKEVADTILHIPVIDCYNIGINKYNFANYFDGTDGTHHNAKGRELLARHITHALF